MAEYSVAVDIGGTFTDVIVIDQADGTTSVSKVPSTPTDLSNGVIEGLRRLLPSLDDVDFFAHGTTVGLNALLQRRGAKCALITTEGFRDVYEMGRGDRADMYNLRFRRPSRLIPRSRVVEVSQRTLADGSIRKQVSSGELDELAGQIQSLDPESVAICLIHAYANPAEEERVAEHLRSRFPEMPISCSSTVANEWREYERTSSAVMNAYIAPVVQRYLADLEVRLRDEGFDEIPHIMQSNGGVMTTAAARELPLGTLLSGPVGGAIGGKAIGDLTGRSNILTIDMGGTSFDVSMVVDGELEVTTETEIEGFPLLTSIVNIHTIGAGGGSLAWTEAGGLRVGPQSAGADPGPACYGRGGTDPTVTDANLLLGRLDPRGLLGGTMELSTEAAEQAHQAIAQNLGLTTIELSEGIVDVINAKMANAIRTLTVARGIDPRTFSLVAFGGAGPLHAAFLAEELDIPEVIVPAVAGIFSAWGMLHTDIRHDLVRSFYRSASETSAEEIQEVYDQLRASGAEVLRQEHIPEDAMEFPLSADMRYVGQEYFVNLTIDGINEGRVPPIEQLVSSFHEAYQRRYGHAIPGASVEFVNIRMAAVGRLPNTSGEAQTPESTDSPQPESNRDVRFDRTWHRTAIHDRSDLGMGSTLGGPAIINETSATTVVPPAFETSVDGYGNLILRRREP